ncbi:Two component system response regulator/histidine kinase, PAS domain-containing [Desulfonema limicola]|uniref:histidine kinase n=1 Tax=Desulfonema limicola TaxID=45656 RepID=A0A975B9K0_9BACT|nr:histidine kinase dimerization/phospho-acceptor domain-containing protein [Desulfonema limicola]QTA81436.1 Two component system response regulator/histidine kinase, PAS domain-containing [Desulfonema limicola]
MDKQEKLPIHDFKGLGHSKIGYFKEVRSKIKELENLNIKLARRHNRLEAVFNSMVNGLTILDNKLNIVYTNHIQKEMFSNIKEGGKCYNVFYQKDEICRNCPALKTLETQEVQHGERLFKHGQLAGKYYEWTISPIKNHFGKVDELLLIMRDITERKEYEFKLMQAHRMASVGFLATGIAHEINNPLTSIAGFSEGLIKRMKKIDEDLKDNVLKSFGEYLEIINNEAYRCKEIIERLREFTRNSSDEYEFLELDRIIKETLVLIRQHAKDNNIRIDFQNHLTAGFNTIKGKESQLKHLFLNLFKNLFNSSEQEKKDFFVIARNDGKRIDIIISDPEGCLSDELSESSLYSFPGSQGVENGITLDLSICYSIIQHHKGDIRSKYTQEHGNTIILMFPAILS